jgi:hypothetical protein
MDFGMQAAAPNVTFLAVKPDEALAQAADADATLGVISPELFGAAKKLKWVHIYSTGVETYRFPAFINSNVMLTNGKIIQGPEIADHAFALLLALTRNMYRAIPNMKKEEFRKQDYQPIELRGKTAVIIGVGGIGSAWFTNLPTTMCDARIALSARPPAVRLTGSTSTSTMKCSVGWPTPPCEHMRTSCCTFSGGGRVFTTPTRSPKISSPKRHCWTMCDSSPARNAS